MTKSTLKTSKSCLPENRDQWAIQVPANFLDYINVPTQKGKSRGEAIVDLMEMCTLKPVEMKLPFGSTVSLVPGQLVVSISDLAEKWNWARETVRKFIGRLEKFGILSKKQLDRCSLITMNILPLDPEFEEKLTSLCLEDSVSAQIDKWLGGETDDTAMAEFLDAHFGHEVDSETNVGARFICILLWFKRLVEHAAGSPFTLTSPAYETLAPRLLDLVLIYIGFNWVNWTMFMRSCLADAISIKQSHPDFDSAVMFYNFVYSISDLIEAHAKNREDD